ncbi:unnamed protein product [Eretmochelys imbricata]
MADTEGENQTSTTGFILLGLRNLPELQILLFLLFLAIYIVTVAGNILIVMLAVADRHLHTAPCTSSWGTCPAWRPATLLPSCQGCWPVS